MKKELSEMSLKELWELFPITLKEHNPKYKEWYEIEEGHLFSCIKDEDIKRINHIGSSAVEGLIAKPTVDILLEVDNNCDITRLIEILKMNSWILMSSEYDPDLKLVFNKGYTLDGLYTEAKSEFIMPYTEKAKLKYTDIYLRKAYPSHSRRIIWIN